MRIDEKSIHRHDKYFLWIIGGVFFALLAVDCYALIRMINTYFFDEPAIQTTEGRFHASSRSSRRGSLISLSTSGGTVEFSCADPGIRQYVGCVRATTSMEGKVARIEWVYSPVNAFSGTARRPIRIDISGLGTVMNKGADLSATLKAWTLKKAVDVGIAAALYFAAFLVIKKLLSIIPRRKS